MHNTTILLTRKDGILVPATEVEAGKLKLFAKSLKEGDMVEAYLSHVANTSDKTLGQLAKVHALIRELASFTGHTFDEIKDQIKEIAGLYLITGTAVGAKSYKSFAECNKEELSLAIQTCIDIGHELGCHLY